MTSLSACIVVYKTDVTTLMATLDSLIVAYLKARHEKLLNSLQVLVIDNGATLQVQDFEKLDSLESVTVKLISNSMNIGFGAAHNQGLGYSETDQHLILNPDVLIDPDAIDTGIRYLRDNHDCGLLAPRGFDLIGQDAYLCKHSPNLLDLFVRGFAPGSIKSLFKKRLSKYEKREAIELPFELESQDVASGCFMLGRTELLKYIGGFDDRFFLYFEDYDLSQRLMTFCKIVYLPTLQVKHAGGQSARKGLLHVCYFLCSAVRYFNKHGWRVW